MAARAFTMRDFWQRVDTSAGPDGCWLWQGQILKGGYGDWVTRKHHRLAHRVAYEATVGPIPDGLHLDHLCRVRRCVNPCHLEAVTPSENLRRQGAAVLVCRNGHPYDTANTYLDPRGKRGCRVCRRIQQQEFHRRKQVA